MIGRQGQLWAGAIRERRWPTAITLRDARKRQSAEETIGAGLSGSHSGTGGPIFGRLKSWLAPVRQHVQLAQCFVYDFCRFASSSASGRRKLNAAHLEALMSIDAHRIEKGLSLPNPRLGFGRDVVERLTRRIAEHRSRGLPLTVSERGASAIRAYLAFHEQAGRTEPWMERVRGVATSRVELNHEAMCGTMTVSRSDFLAAIPAGIDRFFSARHSVRQFAPGPVPDEDIEEAVRLAMRTPSVCNRQSWRVHDYATPEAVAVVLAHQNGNRGFGDQIARVLLVTSDLQTFSKPGERYQCWIDGGMFAMSLVYGLQSLGFGTCTLNCSNDWRRDAALRRAAGIPSNEAVVMMIGVGLLPDTYSVARSPRRAPDEILVRHDQGLSGGLA